MTNRNRNHMKLKIATRIFNEKYFIWDFLNYYLDLGVEEIHLVDENQKK